MASKGHRGRAHSLSLSEMRATGSASSCVLVGGRESQALPRESEEDPRSLSNGKKKRKAKENSRVKAEEGSSAVCCRVLVLHFSLLSRGCPTVDPTLQDARQLKRVQFTQFRGGLACVPRRRCLSLRQHPIQPKPLLLLLLQLAAFHHRLPHHHYRHRSRRRHDFHSLSSISSSLLTLLSRRHPFRSSSATAIRSFVRSFRSASRFPLSYRTHSLPSPHTFSAIHKSTRH